MDAKALINALNEDLANELQAVIMYTVYSAKVSGPWRPQLVQFMQTEIADELLHAQFLADKIVALGGEPATTPVAVPKATTAREMLQAIAEAEQKAVAGYTERAKMAEEFGDKALVVQLEDMVRDEQGHMEETLKLLKNWEDR
ncbi:MAG: ferritin-like domain-containing protein [Chloroflexota bacterium]|nr:ferritin-like domain-containing protein [Anaerolineae bacterium]HMM29589.1 ferritin-like domain-containing protein [Aggregatilineaceae bacterium]